MNEEILPSGEIQLPIVGDTTALPSHEPLRRRARTCKASCVRARAKKCRCICEGRNHGSAVGPAVEGPWEKVFVHLDDPLPMPDAGFDGAIDDVHIWNRPLSDAEIVRLTRRSGLLERLKRWRFQRFQRWFHGQ